MKGICDIPLSANNGTLDHLIWHFNVALHHN